MQSSNNNNNAMANPNNNNNTTGRNRFLEAARPFGRLLLHGGGLLVSYLVLRLWVAYRADECPTAPRV